MSGTLQARLEEERVAAKDELKLSTRALLDKATSDIDTAKRDQRRQLQRLSDDLEHDLEKQRLLLKDRALRGRDRVHSEMQQLQQSSQLRIADLQQRHTKHIEALQEEHEQEVSVYLSIPKYCCCSKVLDCYLQVQMLRKRTDSSIKNNQARVRKQLLRGVESYDDSDPDERSSPPSRSGSGKASFGSPSKTGRSGKSNSSRSPRFSDDEELGSTHDLENTAEEEIELAAVVRAGQEDRDKQLQAEIRLLESETIRLERQWRARAEAEEKSVLATVAVEQEYSQLRRQRGLGGGGGGDEDVAELVVLREQLIQQLQDIKAQSERSAQEEEEVAAEIRVYREGVAAHKARIGDKQEQHRLQLRELQLEHNPKLRELRERVDSVAAQIKDGTEKYRRQVAAVDKEHAQELAKLDNQVILACCIYQVKVNKFPLVSRVAGENRSGATRRRHRSAERCRRSREHQDRASGETHQAVFLHGEQHQCDCCGHSFN